MGFILRAIFMSQKDLVNIFLNIKNLFILMIILYVVTFIFFQHISKKNFEKKTSFFEKINTFIYFF
jgi:hypothetical protein